MRAKKDKIESRFLQSSPWLPATSLFVMVDALARMACDQECFSFIPEPRPASITDVFRLEEDVLILRPKRFSKPLSMTSEARTQDAGVKTDVPGFPTSPLVSRSFPICCHANGPVHSLDPQLNSNFSPIAVACRQSLFFATTHYKGQPTTKMAPPSDAEGQSMPSDEDKTSTESVGYERFFAMFGIIFHTIADDGDVGTHS